MEEHVSRSHSGVGVFVHEMRWPLRPLALLWSRRHLRRHPVPGLLGFDRTGRPVWEPGAGPGQSSAGGPDSAP